MFSEMRCLRSLEHFLCQFLALPWWCCRLDPWRSLCLATWHLDNKLSMCVFETKALQTCIMFCFVFCGGGADGAFVLVNEFFWHFHKAAAQTFDRWPAGIPASPVEADLELRALKPKRNGKQWKNSKVEWYAKGFWKKALFSKALILRYWWRHCSDPKKALPKDFWRLGAWWYGKPWQTFEAPAVELKEKAITPVPDKEPVVMPPVVGGSVLLKQKSDYIVHILKYDWTPEFLSLLICNVSFFWFEKWNAETRIPEPRAPVLQRAFSLAPSDGAVERMVDRKWKHLGQKGIHSFEMKKLS